MFDASFIALSIAKVIAASPEEQAKWPCMQPDYDPAADARRAMMGLYSQMAALNFMAMAMSPHTEIVERCAEEYVDNMTKLTICAVGLEPPP